MNYRTLQFVMLHSEWVHASYNLFPMLDRNNLVSDELLPQLCAAHHISLYAAAAAT